MSTDQGAILLTLARGAIGTTLGETAPAVETADWLDDPGATFVTLTRRGELRGCIGSLIAERPLREDVESNARAAAFRDPRFAPLTRHEYTETRVEISLLSPLQPIASTSEAQLLELLRPGIDGVVLEYGSRRGTFLPQVWEQLPEPRRFLAQLKQKAGLPTGFWDESLVISRYTVTKWREPETRRTEH